MNSPALLVDICIYFFVIAILEEDYDLQAQIQETRNTLHLLVFMQAGEFASIYSVKRVKGPQPLNTYVSG